MFRFTTEDPRGVTLYFSEERWLHVIEEHPELEGQEEVVRLTISESDAILGNPQNSPDLPQRVAQERYVRRDGALNTNIIVAAKVIPPGGMIPGVGVVSTECREAWTAHPTYYPPRGAKLWPPITIA